MYVPFESLPPTARVWIFQSKRPFTAEEEQFMQTRLKSFAAEWRVHGTPLNTSFLIAHRQFIVLGVDETQQMASGCSIDSSVRALKDLEQSFGLSLFERDQVAFKTGDGVLTIPMAKLKENFANGILNEDTLTFYNLVDTKAQLDTEWLVPAKETWLKRYLPGALAKVK